MGLFESVRIKKSDLDVSTVRYVFGSEISNPQKRIYFRIFHGLHVFATPPVHSTFRVQHVHVFPLPFLFRALFCPRTRNMSWVKEKGQSPPESGSDRIRIRQNPDRDLTKYSFFLCRINDNSPGCGDS